MWLKQSTTVNLKLGPFVDFVDGVTAKTALTPTVKLSKNGGTLATRNSATATAHDADGYYTVELDATDTGTLGRLRVTVTAAASHVPVWADYMVVPAAIWDALFGATRLQVDVAAISGDTGAADNAEAFFDGTGYAGTNNVIPTVTTLTGHTAQTGDTFARIGAAGAGLTALGDTRVANLDAAVSSRLATGGYTVPPTAVQNRQEMDSNSTKLANLDATVSSRSTLTAAQANAEADTALADVGLTGIVTGRIDAAVSSRSSHSAADVWAAVTRSLTDKAGFSLSAAGIQAIWDALTSALTTAGSIGKLLVDNINAAIGSRLASAGYTAPDNAGIGVAAVAAAAAAADASTLVGRLTAPRAANLDNLDAAVSSRLPTSGYTAPTTPPTANENADALLDRSNAVEMGLTFRQALRLALSVLGGKLSGGGSTTETFRNAVADSKNRVVATVDASGNRSAVVLDLT